MQSYFQRITSTFNKWLGKRVDFDWRYANQCVDWIKQFASDVNAPITTYGNATDYIRVWLWPNWKIVWDNPVIWDIWIQPKRKWLPYGHIFVVYSVLNKAMTVIEQNRDWKAYAWNNPKNYGSNVAYGKYTLRGDEVFFRRK